MQSLAAESWNEFTCEAGGDRLDTYLAKIIPELSRSRIQKLIEAEYVRVNGSPGKVSLKLAGGEKISVFLPAPKPLGLKPQEIPLHIYYEDEHLVVLEKPAGLVVHPGAGNWDHTLVHALLHRYGETLGAATGIGGELRPGIVHRIDKNTSGVLVITRTDLAHHSLSQQFKEHTITRAYLGIAWGTLASSGDFTEPVGRDPKDRQRMAAVPEGRHARTHFSCVKQYGAIAALFEAELYTGRTHQIRVHFSHHGSPLLGDTMYTNAHRVGRQKKEKYLSLLKKNAPMLAEKIEQLYLENRQCLHAAKLGFTHPATKKELLFTSPLPKDFQEIMAGLEKC